MQYHEKREQAKQITENILKREQNFESNKGSMIKSILERQNNHITLDHVIDNQEYYSDPDEVKNIINEKAKKWTRKRTFATINGTIWEERYKPISHIKQNTFSTIMDPISDHELAIALRDAPSNKAAGPSNIPTECWKKAGKKTKEALLNLLNQCLIQKDIPDEWKKATVILIPKPKNWQGNVDITRPITLIETARKLLTRILTDRIATICHQNKILQGNNISVLKDTCTYIPIYTIINNIAEHAREFGKEA